MPLPPFAVAAYAYDAAADRRYAMLVADAPPAVAYGMFYATLLIRRPPPLSLMLAMPPRRWPALSLMPPILIVFATAPLSRERHAPLIS